MSLSKKYDIPEDKIKALIKDGWIVCTATRYEEIFKEYNLNISKGVPSTQAVHNASVKCCVNERWVWKVIKKFD
jgi:hypothetical protein